MEKAEFKDSLHESGIIVRQYGTEAPVMAVPGVAGALPDWDALMRELGGGIAVDYLRDDERRISFDIEKWVQRIVRVILEFQPSVLLLHSASLTNVPAIEKKIRHALKAIVLLNPADSKPQKLKDPQLQDADFETGGFLEKHAKWKKLLEKIDLYLGSLWRSEDREEYMTMLVQHLYGYMGGQLFDEPRKNTKPLKTIMNAGTNLLRDYDEETVRTAIEQMCAEHIFAICGGEDRWHNKDFDFGKKIQPVIFEGMGHYGHRERPQDVSDTIRSQLAEIGIILPKPCQEARQPSSQASLQHTLLS